MWILSSWTKAGSFAVKFPSAMLPASIQSPPKLIVGEAASTGVSGRRQQPLQPFHVISGLEHE
jgi:hypothetical protein